MDNVYYLVDGMWHEKEARLNAGNKAREDVNEILAQLGFFRVDAAGRSDMFRNGMVGKLRSHFDRAGIIRNAVASVPDGAILFVQFPLVLHTVFFTGVMRAVQRRGVKVVLLLHDVELLRSARVNQTGLVGKIRIAVEERSALAQCDAIVVHNESMAKCLASECGIRSEKMVSLDLFDYLCNEDGFRAATDVDDSIVVAGNLSPLKAEYLYSLADIVSVRAYGVGLDEKRSDKIEYVGAFNPKELPSKMRGSFGLVWDGPDTGTCSGAFGEYLRVNNPHKTSLYLASGLPVVIWEHAALAATVIESGCGMTVSSLSDVPEAIGRLGENEYASMVASAQELGAKVREGFFTRRMVDRVLEVLA